MPGVRPLGLQAGIPTLRGLDNLPLWISGRLWRGLSTIRVAIAAPILCTEEKGTLRSRRIVCPYHAWAYDLDGQLVAAPRRMATPDFEMGDFSLFQVAVGSWGGFVFVNLAGKDAAPLSDGLGAMPEPVAYGGRIIAQTA